MPPLVPPGNDTWETSAKIKFLYNTDENEEMIVAVNAIYAIA